MLFSVWFQAICLPHKYFTLKVNMEANTKINMYFPIIITNDSI